MVDAIQNSFQERLSSFSNTFFCQEDNSGGTVQLNLNLTEHACRKEANQLKSSCISLPTATVATCNYTTRVVWQTKYKLMMCISRVSCVFAILCVHAKTVCNSECTH